MPTSSRLRFWDSRARLDNLLIRFASFPAAGGKDLFPRGKSGTGTLCQFRETLL